MSADIIEFPYGQTFVQDVEKVIKVTITGGDGGFSQVKAQLNAAFPETFSVLDILLENLRISPIVFYIRTLTIDIETLQKMADVKLDINSPREYIFEDVTNKGWSI